MARTREKERKRDGEKTEREEEGDGFILPSSFLSSPSVARTTTRTVRGSSALGAARRGSARRALQRGATGESPVRNLRAYLYEGFHGALGYVQERGSPTQISPLIHRGRCVDQKYYNGHLQGDYGDCEGDDDDGDGGSGGDDDDDGGHSDSSSGGGGGGGGDDEIRVALARRNVLVLVC